VLIGKLSTITSCNFEAVSSSDEDMRQSTCEKLEYVINLVVLNVLLYYIKKVIFAYSKLETAQRNPK
jgi:hypothetical protein